MDMVRHHRWILARAALRFAIIYNLTLCVVLCQRFILCFKEEEEGWKMAPSNFLPIMEEGNSKYKGKWRERNWKQKGFCLCAIYAGNFYLFILFSVFLLRLSGSQWTGKTLP